MEEDVWHNFTNDPKKLSETAKAIHLIVEKGAVPKASQEEDEEFAEAEEGRILTRVHRSRERSRKLVEQKKASVLKASGKLKCEACSFDFEEAYGERGKGFIEVHHIKPVHTLAAGDKTRLEDLALLCSNCHRIVHARQPWLTIEKLARVSRGLGGRAHARHAAQRRHLHHRPAAAPEWQTAISELMLAVERNRPTMMARIGVMRALNRGHVREFNPDRKITHWGKQELKRDRE